jgi:hypothetical protein
VSHSNTGPGSAGSGNAGPVGGQWDWVREYEASGCLMFARGVSAEHMMSSFGMDPGLAMMLPAEQAAEACPLPVYDEKFQPIHPWVRAGKVGEWAFAIDETLILFWDRNVDLSAGTEAVFVHWTAKPTYGVTYVIDGGVVTQFDPGMAWDRAGSEPDKFLREMREAGLRTERPEPRPALTREEYIAQRRQMLRGPRRDPIDAALEVMTLALDIRLPQDVVRGPLLTVQRR